MTNIIQTNTDIKTKDTEELISLWDFSQKEVLSSDYAGATQLTNQSGIGKSLELSIKNQKGWLADVCSIKEIPEIVNNQPFSEIILELYVPEENFGKKSDYQEIVLTFITRDQMWYELKKQPLQAGENIVTFIIPDPEKLKKFRKMNVILNSDIKWNTNIFIKRILAVPAVASGNKQMLWEFNDFGNVQGFVGNIMHSQEYYSQGSGALKIVMEKHEGWNENICVATSIPACLKSAKAGLLFFDCYFPPEIKRKPTDFFVIHVIFIAEDNEIIEVGKASIDAGWNYCSIPISNIDQLEGISKIKFALNSSFKLSSSIYLSNFRWEEK